MVALDRDQGALFSAPEHYNTWLTVKKHFLKKFSNSYLLLTKALNDSE
jgi:hypothetical protein